LNIKNQMISLIIFMFIKILLLSFVISWEWNKIFLFCYGDRNIYTLCVNYSSFKDQNNYHQNLMRWKVLNHCCWFTYLKTHPIKRILILNESEYLHVIFNLHQVDLDILFPSFVPRLWFINVLYRWTTYK
jgi:disulfide oxidoreductase YuzD